MPACHASYVSIEEIDSWGPSTQAVTSNATRALLEQWCVHELQWVTSENHNAPSLWEHLNQELESSDGGYLTGNYHCIVCGEPGAKKL
jgi:hypothetical protein